MELGRPVKYAHKLTERVLNPKSIEKTNVDLSCRFFHESTVHALQYYAESEGLKHYAETATFFRLVLRFWNTVNVKNPRAGFMKRDETSRPITLNDKTSAEFLCQFVDWLNEWENMPRKTALTKETFTAVKQTAAALRELAEYLLGKGLKFVLLGMINSDPLEKRFGWYRQLSGANYFASVRQFLEAEKKIRIKCLVKHGQVSLQEVREVFKESNEAEKQKILSDCAVLLDSLPIDSLSGSFELEKGEEGIVYFIAGYIARSLLKTVKCDGCVNLLRKNEAIPLLEFEEDVENTESAAAREAREAYLDLINSGGLVSPSDLVNVASVHALQLKKVIFDNGDAQRIFLESGCPRDVFVKCYTNMLQRESTTIALLNQKCENGHNFDDFVPKIASRVFNIFSKNFISEINDKIHVSRKRGGNQEGSTSRKISKLQSSNGN
jgi:hypothetical protein